MSPPSPAKENNKGPLTVAIRKSPRTHQKEAFARRTAAIEAEFRKSARKKLNKKEPKKKEVKKTKKDVSTKGTAAAASLGTEKKIAAAASLGTDKNRKATTAASLGTDNKSKATAAASLGTDKNKTTASASLGTDMESNKKSDKKRKSDPQQSASSKSSKGAAKVAKVAMVRKVVTRRTAATPEEEEERSSDDDNSSVAEFVLVRTAGTKQHNPKPPIKEEKEQDSDDDYSSEPPRYCSNRENLDDGASDDDGTSYHTAEHSSSDDDDDILNNENDDEAAVDDEDDSTISNNNYKMTRTGRDMHTGHADSEIQLISTVSRAPISTLAGLDNETLHIRGMSRSQSIRNRQKHVTDRVRTFVKSDIFRKIKFINSDASFQKAMKLVMDHENVPEAQRGRFQMLYESVFNEALNTKRSSCEQSGGKIVQSTIAKFELTGEDFFTMDELIKLRRATTEREMQAFHWFFGTFLECVCGRRYWGKQKVSELISEAREPGGRGKVVTRSDEAFALLLFENYIDKWRSPPPVVADEVDDSGTGEQDAPKKKKAKPKRRGTYTGKKSGHCKYGGWSHEGMARFNELYKLVQEDRACPQAEVMEKELLSFCRSQAGLVHGRDAQGGERGNDTSVPAAMDTTFVEAAWDLDD